MYRIKSKELPLVKVGLLKRQNYTCATCPQTLTVLTACVDHDHSTGLIRGVLCRNCNGIEGKIRNLATRGRRGLPHADYLQRMVDYWVHHSVDQTGLLHHLHKTDDEKRIRTNTLARKRRAVAKKKAA